MPKASSRPPVCIINTGPSRSAKTARMHGTPIYVWKNGKDVAEKP